jgi:hypothetical protein
MGAERKGNGRIAVESIKVAISVSEFGWPTSPLVGNVLIVLFFDSKYPFKCHGNHILLCLR